MTQRETIHCKILIIGAGPAGLAIAGRLKKAGIDFRMLERDQHIASMWHKHYDRLRLHTVKQSSHLPEQPFPADYPLYVPREKLVQYYTEYADKFGIKPVFGIEAQKIEREKDSWKVITNSNTYLAGKVVVATGSNRLPICPQWPGEEEFTGSIIHSRDYKNPYPFKGKKVLVIGMGNTGAEIALDLAEHDIETYISVRSPVNIVPRDVLGRPAQLTAQKLEKLPFGLGRIISRISTRMIIGDLSKYGLKKAKMDPVQQLRTTGQTPVIDLGTVKKIKEGQITVLPEILRFVSDGVILNDENRVEIDQVILATGYRSGIDQMIENSKNLLDEHGLPKDCIGRQEFEGLYFLGFDNYKLGGILGTIYSDSEKVLDAISH
ncbi:MAG: NAD(P)/FAD-dependent oxidoreductase [Saprospiraceae bacterium]|nr:NAD(P)/FAD-dependent oxidoreductase [Saprospiraceae bacterium]